MPGATGPFRREHRLLRPREFRNVLQRGRRTSARAFVVFVVPPGAPSRADRAPAAPRLGITVSRKVGNAVARNRVKRRVREWFRHQRGTLPPGSELVVIGRRGAAELSGREVALELDDALRRASGAVS